MNLPRLISRFLGRPDYADEIAFWAEILATRPASIADPHYREDAFPRYLRVCVDEMRKRQKSSVKVLEVGSGPLSLLAAGVDEGLFNLTAIDPLATVYERLMQQNGLCYPVEPRKGHAEKLLRDFEPESFDIVYSSNALDHTISPGESLRQMSQVVRQGGIIFLEGFVRNASREKWWGLHQHDLCPEGGHLMHYSRSGERTDLTGTLPLACIYETIVLFTQRSINAFGYEMRPGVELAANYQFWDWYVIAFRRV